MKRTIIALTLAGTICAGAQIVRWDLAVLKPSQHGSLTVYKFFAAEDWRRAGGSNALDTPNRGDTWPLLADMDGTPGGLQILNYRDGKWTNRSGSPWRAPMRWAYVRLAEDVWTGTTHTPPGVSASSPVTVDLMSTMRWLQASGYTKKQMMDAMDRLVWTDGTGAPE